MNDLDQIAAEAREQIFNAIHFSATERQERITESLIQSACEKATEEPVELLRSVHNWFMKSAPQHYNGCGLWLDVDAFLTETESRAAHASEPPDKIFEEAWKEITDYADNCEDAIGDLAGDTNCIRIIKSACEKATEELSKERNDLAAALQRLMKAVEINLLCGTPEIKTVDDVIRGMRTVADKLIQVSESRAAHRVEKDAAGASDSLTPEELEGAKAIGAAYVAAHASEKP